MMEWYFSQAQMIVLDEIANGEREFPATPEAMESAVRSVVRWLISLSESRGLVIRGEGE